MKVELKNMSISNFRGISAEVTFNQGETLILGKNGCGKTTIMSAWLWLLLGKADTIHPANYEIFNNKEELTPQSPRVSVKAKISIEGVEYDIERTAKAGFTKDKSTMEYIKSPSDKYEFFIDGIAYKATEFNSWIDENIAPVSILPYILDGAFFSTLADEKKDKALEVLHKIIGVVRDDDYENDYSIIQHLLGKASEEQIIQMSRKNMKELREKMNALDAKKSVLIDMKIQNQDVSQDKISRRKELKDKSDAILDEIAGVNKENAPQEKQRNEVWQNLRSKQLKFDSNRNTYLAGIDALRTQKKAQISEVLQKLECTRKNVVEKKHKLLKIDEEIKLVEENILKLRQKRDEIKNQSFVPTVCPTCGLSIECDEEALEKAKLSFENDKAERLKMVVSFGKQEARKLDALKAQKEDMEHSISDDELLLESKLVETDMDKSLEDFEKSVKAYEDTDEGKALMTEIISLQEEFDSIKIKDATMLLEELTSLHNEISKLDREIGSCKSVEDLEKEITAIDDERKDIGVQISRELMIEDAAKRREQERAQIVSKRINNMLDGCSIQVWKMQKDGTRVPDCVILDSNGVKYGSTNTSERIKVNIALQRMFSKHYDVVLPIFVDEMSVFSTENKPKIDTQHIFMYATDDNKMVIR